MKVFTYFNQVPELKDPALIQMWLKSWSRLGWEPVILSENDAKRADSAMYQRFNRSPLMESRNPVGYTRAAMLRWVAMTAVKEPCIHVDWDVFCNGLRPEDLQIEGRKPIFLSSSTCPCAVAATPQGWKFLAALIELAPFLPSFSREALLADSCDQYATGISHPDYVEIHPRQMCALYNEDKDWQNAPMIHFPNRLTPYPRSRVVAEFKSLFA